MTVSKAAAATMHKSLSGQFPETGAPPKTRAISWRHEQVAFLQNTFSEFGKDQDRLNDAFEKHGWRSITKEASLTITAALGEGGGLDKLRDAMEKINSQSLILIKVDHADKPPQIEHVELADGVLRVKDDDGQFQTLTKEHNLFKWNWSSGEIHVSEKPKNSGHSDRGARAAEESRESSIANMAVAFDKRMEKRMDSKPTETLTSTPEVVHVPGGLLQQTVSPVTVTNAQNS